MFTVCRLCSYLALTAFLFAAAASPGQRRDYDFVISGARVIDGTGAPWTYEDIGIVGDHIAAMGDLHDATSQQRIDAAGLVVSPGFIDVQGQSEFNILVDNRAASKITQGVTTEITGEGTSIGPLNGRLVEDFKDDAKKYGITLDWRSLDEYLQRLRSCQARHQSRHVCRRGRNSYLRDWERQPAGNARRTRTDARVGGTSYGARCIWSKLSA